MAWNTYTQLMSGKKEEEIVQIYENIVVPLMGGSKVIHVRTHEEKRLEGICETFSDFNDEQASLEEKIAAMTDRYTNQFAAMETAVTGFKKTGEFLTGFIDSLNPKD